MPVDLKFELISGARIEQTPTSVRVYRVARVKAFTDVDNPHLSLINAHDAAGLPVVGDAYPDRPLVILKNKFTIPLSDDLAIVTMVYEWQFIPSTYLKSFHSSLQQKIVNYDKDGVKADITFTPPGSSSAAGAYTCDLQRYVATASLNYNLFATGDPESEAVAHTGFVNSTTWRGYPPRTWMAMEIAGATDDNNWYRKSYQFQYRPETWDDFQVYRDGHGRVPPGVATIDFSGTTTSGNGWKRFRVMKEIDFNSAFPLF